MIVGIIPSIILFSTVIMLLKMVILIGIFLYFRFSSRIAFSLAVFLFQVSENAFILLSLAYTNKIFTEQQYLFILSSSLVSLVLTPLIIHHKDTMYSGIRAFLKRY